MIYIDQPRSFLHKRKLYSHMMADTLEELHSFAEFLGIKRHWFDRYHYDVRQDDYVAAVLAGAKVVSSKDLVRIRKKLFTRR